MRDGENIGGGKRWIGRKKKRGVCISKNGRRENFMEIHKNKILLSLLYSLSSLI